MSDSHSSSDSPIPPAAGTRRARVDDDDGADDGHALPERERNRPRTEPQPERPLPQRMQQSRTTMQFMLSTPQQQPIAQFNIVFDTAPVPVPTRPDDPSIPLPTQPIEHQFSFDTGPISGERLFAAITQLTSQFGGAAAFAEREPDEARAKRIIRALESVPRGLVQRINAVGGVMGTNSDTLDDRQGSGACCAVCWEPLLDDGSFVSDKPTHPADDGLTATPGTTDSEDLNNDDPNSPIEGVVALPCRHVFHASCLLPWFSRQTTCPSCRFNLDPENLTWSYPRFSRSFQRRHPPPHGTAPMPPQNAHPVPPTSDLSGSAPTPIIVDPPTAPPAAPSINNSQSSAPPASSTPGPSAGTEVNPVPEVSMIFLNAPPNLVPFGPSPSMMEPNSQATPSQPTDIPAGNAVNWLPAGFPQELRQFFSSLFGSNAVPVNVHTGPARPSTIAGSQPSLGRPAENTASNEPAAATHPPTPLQTLPLPGRSIWPTYPSFTSPFAPPGAHQAMPANDQTPTVIPIRAPATQFVTFPTNTPLMSGTAGFPLDFAFPLPHTNPMRHQGQSPTAGVTGQPNPTEHQHPEGTPPFSPFPRGFPFHSIPHMHFPRPRERKEWSVPEGRGASVRQRVEEKEREIGLRCFDPSCGLGPTDETPLLQGVRPETMLIWRDVTDLGERPENACEHAFHSGCLVSAARVAGFGPQDNEDDPNADVEVSCVVCRAQGHVGRDIWNAGVRQLSDGPVSNHFVSAIE